MIGALIPARRLPAMPGLRASSIECGATAGTTGSRSCHSSGLASGRTRGSRWASASSWSYAPGPRLRPGGSGLLHLTDHRGDRRVLPRRGEGHCPRRRPRVSVRPYAVHRPARGLLRGRLQAVDRHGASPRREDNHPLLRQHLRPARQVHRVGVRRRPRVRAHRGQLARRCAGKSRRQAVPGRQHRYHANAGRRHVRAGDGGSGAGHPRHQRRRFHPRPGAHTCGDQRRASTMDVGGGGPQLLAAPHPLDLSRVERVGGGLRLVSGWDLTRNCVVVERCASIPVRLALMTPRTVQYISTTAEIRMMTTADLVSIARAIGTIPTRPRRKKTIPRENRATMFSPHVLLNIFADSLMESITPKPWNINTGITKKVMRFQAMPMREAMIAPKMPALSRIALSITPTVAFIAAHPAILPMFFTAMSQPYLKSGSPPRRHSCAHAIRPVLCAGSLHRGHLLPILAVFTPLRKELDGREVAEGLVWPHVIVRVVPSIDQLVEIGSGVGLPVSPELVLGRLYLALHVGVLFWAVRVGKVVRDELLLGRLIEVLQELLGALGAPRGEHPAEGDPGKAVDGGELVELYAGEAKVLGVHLDQTPREGVLHPPLGPEPLLAPLGGLGPLAGLVLVVEALALQDTPHGGGGQDDAVVSLKDDRDLVLAPGRLIGPDRADEVGRPPGDGRGPAVVRRPREVLEASRTSLGISCHPLVQGASRDPEPAGGDARVSLFLVVGEPCHL